MRIDIIDVFRFYSGPFQSQLHAASRSCAVWKGGGHMIGISGEPVSGQFTVDGCVSLPCMFEFLKKEDPCSLCNDEPVPVAIEWTGSFFGFIVSGAEGFHGAETADSGRHDRGFGSTSQEGVGFPELDHSHGLAEGVAGGGAGCGDGEIRAAASEFHRDQSAGHIGDHHGDQKWRYFPGAFLKEIAVLFLECGETADAATDDDPDPVEVHFFKDKLGIAQSHLGCRHGELSISVAAPNIFWCFVKGHGIEVAHLSRDTGAVFRDVERLDGADATFSSDQVSPEGGQIKTERGDDPDSGDDNTAITHGSYLSDMICRRK